MRLPAELVCQILEMAFEDLEFMLIDVEQYGHPETYAEVHSQWSAVDEVLYDFKVSQNSHAVRAPASNVA